MNKGKGSASLCRAANVSFVKLSPVYFTLILIDKVFKTINKKPIFSRIIFCGRTLFTYGIFYDIKIKKCSFEDYV